MDKNNLFKNQLILLVLVDIRLVTKDIETEVVQWDLVKNLVLLINSRYLSQVLGHTNQIKI